jgi:hypothetical protein
MTRRPGAVDCAPMTAADDAYKRAGAEYSAAPPEASVWLAGFGYAAQARLAGHPSSPPGRNRVKSSDGQLPLGPIKSLASASCCALVVFQRTPFSRALEEMQVLAEKLAQSSGSGAGVTSVRKT